VDVESALASKDLTGRRAWSQLYNERCAAWRFTLPGRDETLNLAEVRSLRDTRTLLARNALREKRQWPLVSSTQSPSSAVAKAQAERRGCGTGPPRAACRLLR
jgi:hypothetical protein